MISDYAFFRGIDNSVNLLSKFGDQPTYYYLYRHRSDLSLPKFLGTPSNLELGKKTIITETFQHLSQSDRNNLSNSTS